jgi:hypothetical protein
MSAAMDMHQFEYEPEGLGHELLIEWAPWARDDKDGERASWALKPRVDPGYHGDPPKNFFIVEKIVAPHRVQKDDYWRAVSAVYLGEKPEWSICREFGWSRLRLKTNIIVFCGLVEREWRDYTTARRVLITRAR